jgi:5-methyltetrahydropteroyltriglutamate--homocysteine methyltransferase
LPHPFGYQLMYGPESKQAYPDPYELFYDAAVLLKEECRDLAGLGCEYIQIDAPVLTMPLDSDAAKNYARLGTTPEQFIREGVKIMDVIADVPGVHFAVHYCRGNSPTGYFSDGAYDKAAELLFNGTEKIGTFLLEYDDARAGSFEALRHVPDNKIVVLGLVSSMKQPEVERVEDVVARVAEAAQYFPKENLALSTQCGFCSKVGLEGFDATVQREKLTCVVDAAREIWPE